MSCPDHAHIRDGLVFTNTFADCLCDPGTYAPDWPVTACAPCPDDARCDGGLSLPYPRPGFWSAAHAPTKIYECRYKDLCSGGAAPAACAARGAFGFAENECAGPLDATGATARLQLADRALWCKRRWDADTPFCEDNTDDVYTFSFYALRCPTTPWVKKVQTAAFFTILAVSFIGINDVLRPRLPLFDLVLDTYQMMGIISQFRLDWPVVLQKSIFIPFTVALFDIDIYEPACAFPDWSWLQTLSLMCAAPLLYATVRLLLGVVRFVRGVDRTRQNWDRAMGDVLQFALAASPSLVTYCVSTLLCRPVAGRRVLAEAPEFECAGRAFAAARVLATLVLAIVVVALPLYCHIKVSQFWRSNTLKDQSNLHRFGFIYADLRPGKIVFGMIRDLRCMVLAFVATLLWRYPITQSLVGMCILVTSLTLTSHHLFFLDAQKNVFESFSGVFFWF